MSIRDQILRDEENQARQLQQEKERERLTRETLEKTIRHDQVDAMFRSLTTAWTEKIRKTPVSKHYPVIDEHYSLFHGSTKTVKTVFKRNIKCFLEYAILTYESNPENDIQFADGWKDEIDHYHTREIYDYVDATNQIYIMNVRECELDVLKERIAEWLQENDLRCYDWADVGGSTRKFAVKEWPPVEELLCSGMRFGKLSEFGVVLILDD